MAPSYVLAIDQGTTSSRALLFRKDGTPMSKEQLDLEQHYPHPGWAEHDPNEILNSVVKCCQHAMEKGNAHTADIASIGITNQRETTVAWDRVTGEPYHKAIVWLDTRTSETVGKLIHGPGGQDRFRAKTGLPISTYFSAVKMKWLLDNVPEVKKGVDEKRCMFGTIESWLIYKLTGGHKGGIHITDVSNASRYMLMNLQTQQWDLDICRELGIPVECLPEIRSNAEVYGKVKGYGQLNGIPIAGALGDQHAALLGQGCLEVGSSKNTYGTGCFMLLNTGNKAVPSKSGLLTTVGFKLGADAKTQYALEGSVACAGRTVQWLRDNMGLIDSAPEIEKFASSVADTGGVTLVPAFSGLFAPYWREDARAIAVGMSLYTNKAHLCRAALEAVAFSTVDVMEAMKKDVGHELGSMHVDGGMTANNFLMKLQADLLGVEVLRARMPEATVLGAAFAAGLAVNFYQKVEEVKEMLVHAGGWESFPNQMSMTVRDREYARWRDAVTRAMDLQKFDSMEKKKKRAAGAHRYILSIDQGTTSSRALLFDSEGGAVAKEQMELKQHYPHPGWAEHDPKEILDCVVKCCQSVMKQAGAQPGEVAAIGITNQRETTVAWDRVTGEPYHKAIVWLDTRTSETVQQLTKAGGKDRFRKSTGLPVSTYFSAVKMKWLIDNVPEVKKGVAEKRCMFGTIESWLIYNLTGGTDRGLHITDISNASRYMLMNLETSAWDPAICRELGIDQACLPTIKSNSEVYGLVSGFGSLNGIPIAGALGDQHAALLGQGCIEVGSSKNTYGTGCFMLLNTGFEAVPSKSGLLTTVGFKLGSEAKTYYALEGSVACAGRTVQWLRDNMGLIENAGEIESLAKSVENTGGVTLVPAFSGLFAPYWREDARAVAVGMTLYTNREHLCRAALEAVAFSTVDVMEAMKKDTGRDLGNMHVDGGMTANNFLMQMQADYLGVDVLRARMPEATVLGAAFAAGLAVGFYKKLDDVKDMLRKAGGWESFPAKMDFNSRMQEYTRWKDAVNRAMDLNQFESKLEDKQEATETTAASPKSASPKSARATSAPALDGKGKKVGCKFW
eukprot:CAMPEP_0206440560 /NCGR_PEP_ID=MMETSP0324_2-20121206/12816_1 /ASSEMBLY_ACC=CAM_ASM_000836 /TAXON_ID=2866 /ORGANISM="Crypthecodinium cohnii, Strain Seligo" /LENGTH=1070 /DNA_ID=CAMNT_0053908269 /DNA_START=69 /DNA_END=3281 /DNA_ORIENTATION=-